MTVPEFGYEYLCGGNSPSCRTFMQKDDTQCSGCDHWFPRPDQCTCAYDGGHIYPNKDCKIGAHAEKARYIERATKGLIKYHQQKKKKKKESE